MSPSLRGSAAVRNGPKGFGEARSRRTVLTAATHDFARMGLAGAGIQSIATAARVSIALLYYYFETKEKLFAGRL